MKKVYGTATKNYFYIKYRKLSEQQLRPTNVEWSTEAVVRNQGTVRWLGSLPLMYRIRVLCGKESYTICNLLHCKWRVMMHINLPIKVKMYDSACRKIYLENIVTKI